MNATADRFEGFTGTADVPSAFSLSGNTNADKMSAVPVPPSSLKLPGHLREQLIAAARAAYPRECCGLIEGVRRGATIEALILHPTRNLACEADRFEIDPAEQFRLLKRLRGTDREVVGCYHSHPNGEPVPSQRDLAGAGEEGFVWLIAAQNPDEPAALAAHVYADGAFHPLGLA
jgi:proteasome lid subunit RPN8/RPN11